VSYFSSKIDLNRNTNNNDENNLNNVSTSNNYKATVTSMTLHKSTMFPFHNTSQCNQVVRALSSASLSQLNQNQNQGEIVTFLGLNNLSDNPGAVKKARRLGRGIGSSKGKTCGRGHKGQKSRAGKGVSPLFEGGQTPFYKRIPKRGFTNKHATPMVPINVGTIQEYIDMKRLDIHQTITMKQLVEAGITKNSSIKHGIKLLGKGAEKVTSPIKIEISRASKSAIRAIESVEGGSVTTVHYNRLALRALLKPEKFEIIPRRALPPPKLMPYYTNYENRGFLSPEVQFKKVTDRLDMQSKSANTV
jgi:large subunit ribosomal protein L15